MNLPFTEEEILDIAPSFIDLLKMFGQRSEEFSDVLEERIDL